MKADSKFYGIVPVIITILLGSLITAIVYFRFGSEYLELTMLIINVILAIFVARMGKNRTIPTFLIFLLSIIFSSLVGFLLVMFSKLKNDK